MRNCLFFRAEDGLRDVAVTGVQTCALPISRPGISGLSGPKILPDNPDMPGLAAEGTATVVIFQNTSGTLPTRNRSEERRVGKECRSRWSAYHEKKYCRRVETQGDERAYDND